MVKKIARAAASYLLLLVAIVFFGMFLYGRKEQLARLSEVPPRHILMVMAFTTAYLFVNAFSIKELMKAFGRDLTFKEWFGLSCCTTMFNYFLPARSGVMPRAVYMKRKYDFSYSTFFSAYLGFYIFSFFANAAFGLVLLIFNYRSTGVMYVSLLFLFGGVFLASGGFILLCQWLSRRGLRHRLLNNVLNGLDYFHKQKKLLMSLLFLNFINMLILAGRLMFSYRAIGVDPGVVPMLILANVVFFAFVIGLTPASLGIKEAVITVTSALIGFSSIDGALASIVDRGANLLMVFTFGVIFSILLFKDLWSLKDADITGRGTA